MTVLAGDGRAREPAAIGRRRCAIGALAGLIGALCAPHPARGAEAFARIRGANYVPSYARNDVGIWMDFDPEVVDRELGFAERLRLDSVRIFLQYLVYEREPEAFLDRFETFLRLCGKHGIRAMPVLFDSCFGKFPSLETYRTDDWVANPGQDRIGPEHWPALDRYVRDVVGGHRDDRRIVAWDVMNEPMVTSWARREEEREKIWRFLDHALDAVHARKPVQPATVGFSASRFIPRVLEKLDLLAFHNYTGDAGALRADIRRVKALGARSGKPVVINEIARRPHQTYRMIMPILEEERIGWYVWELMLGRTQFSRGEHPIQGVVYPDGTCRDPREIACIVGIPPREGPLPAHRAPGEIDDMDTAGFLLYSPGWTLWRGDGPRRGTLHYAKEAARGAVRRSRSGRGRGSPPADPRWGGSPPSR